MTQQATEGYWLQDAEKLAGKVGRWARKSLQAASTVIRASNRPVAQHLVDHAYSFVGIGCISAAFFVHSTFSGLLVTGILCLVFEWKVGDDES